jgi:hypothetical protein
MVPFDSGWAADRMLFGAGTMLSGLVPADMAVADLVGLAEAPHPDSAMTAKNTAVAAAERHCVLFVMAIPSELSSGTR